MLQVYARAIGSARFEAVKPHTHAGRAILDQACEIQVITAMAGKSTLMAHAEKVNHFARHTGVMVTVEGGFDGEAAFTATGIDGLGYAWAWLLVRLAGRQEAIVESLATMHQPSRVREQFVRQFLPSITAGGSRLAQYGTKADLLGNKDFEEILYPILKKAGLW